jgi:hypothetical protein
MPEDDLKAPALTMESALQYTVNKILSDDKTEVEIVLTDISPRDDSYVIKNITLPDGSETDEEEDDFTSVSFVVNENGTYDFEVTLQENAQVDSEDETESGQQETGTDAAQQKSGTNAVQQETGTDTTVESDVITEKISVEVDEIPDTSSEDRTEVNGTGNESGNDTESVSEANAKESEAAGSVSENSTDTASDKSVTDESGKITLTAFAQINDMRDATPSILPVDKGQDGEDYYYVNPLQYLGMEKEEYEANLAQAEEMIASLDPDDEDDAEQLEQMKLFTDTTAYVEETLLGTDYQAVYAIGDYDISDTGEVETVTVPMKWSFNAEKSGTDAIDFAVEVRRPITFRRVLHRRSWYV